MNFLRYFFPFKNANNTFLLIFSHLTLHVSNTALQQVINQTTNVFVRDKNWNNFGVLHHFYKNVRKNPTFSKDILSHDILSQEEQIFLLNNLQVHVSNWSTQNTAYRRTTAECFNNGNKRGREKRRKKFQRRHRANPGVGTFIFAVERRQAGASSLRKHVTAPAKLAYAANAIRRRDRQKTRVDNATMNRSREEKQIVIKQAANVRDPWGTLFSFRSMIGGTLFEHDWCKTVSRVYGSIDCSRQKWQIYRSSCKSSSLF